MANEKRDKARADAVGAVKPLTNSAHFNKLSRLMLGKIEADVEADIIQHIYGQPDEHWNPPHEGRYHGYGDGVKLRKPSMPQG